MRTYNLPDLDWMPARRLECRIIRSLSIALSKRLLGEKTVMPSTVRLHRVLSTTPEKVYRAFIEADAVAQWLPPNGFTCTVHTLDAKAGGTHRMSFRNFTTGNSHSFGGNTWSSCPASACATRTRSTTPICPAKCR